MNDTITRQGAPQRSFPVDTRAPHTQLTRTVLRVPPVVDRSALQLQCSTEIRSTSGALEDGGDFAEVFTLPDSSVAVGVWDASGHGRCAAPNMTLVRAGWRAMMSAKTDVACAMEALNRVLVRQATGAAIWPFVAGFFGVIDRTRGTLRYVSCGHDAAILFRTGGTHVHLDHNSPVLGIDEAAQFRVDTVALQRGDALVIVTDGVTEARPLNSQTDFFGSRRLCSLFDPRQGASESDAGSLIDHVTAYSDGWLDDDAAAFVGRICEGDEMLGSSLYGFTQMTVTIDGTLRIRVHPMQS